MLKKISLVMMSIATLVLMSTTPVQAQSFWDTLFGGGSKSGGTGGGCGDTKTHLVGCSGETGVEAIGEIIRTTLIVMTTLIGIMATGALAYAGILYASARDDKEKVSQAMSVIRNVVVGLLLYVFTIAIIGWLIPGSVIEAPPPSDSNNGASG